MIKPPIPYTPRLDFASFRSSPRQLDRYAKFRTPRRSDRYPFLFSFRSYLCLFLPIIFAKRRIFSIHTHFGRFHSRIFRTLFDVPSKRKQFRLRRAIGVNLFVHDGQLVVTCPIQKIKKRRIAMTGTRRTCRENVEEILAVYRDGAVARS